MLHNLFHWVPPFTGENEFSFAAERVSLFTNLLTSQPQHFINIAFSFLGHFGVQVFIMISGYGLTKSMLNKPQNWASFMGSRLKKIYPLLIVAILAYTATTFIITKQMPAFDVWREICRKLLLIHTLIPNSGLSVCGPWWFFGLIVQLYVLFPILLHMTKLYGTKTLAITIVLSYVWIFIALYNYDHPKGDLLSMQNSIGHLPEFCFGIWLALTPRKISNWWLLPALIVFGLGNTYQSLYPFTFLAVCIVFVIIYDIVRKPITSHAIIRRPIAFLGSVSMFLFAVHGFLREPFLNLASSPNAATGLLAAIMFIATSIAVAIVIRPLYNLIVKMFDKIKSPTWLPKANNFIMGGTLLLLAFAGYHQATSLIRTDIVFSQNAETKKCTFTTNNVVGTDTLYSSILRIKLGHCGLIKVSVDVEVDTEETEKEQNPLLVTELGRIFWDKLELPQTDCYAKIHYENTIYCSFFDRLKRKTLKIYFWNYKSSSMSFRNAEVKISYQK